MEENIDAVVKETVMNKFQNEPKVWSKKKQWIFIAVLFGVILAFFSIWGIVEKQDQEKEKAHEQEYHSKIKENETQIGKLDGCNKVVCLVINSSDDGDKYSDAFVPNNLAAQSADEAAIIVRLVQDKILEGSYGEAPGPVSSAYQQIYLVEWYDARFDEVIIKDTIYGSLPPASADPNYDHSGMLPQEEDVEEWIEKTYALVFEKPYIDEANGAFHLVLHAGFTKNTDGSYEYSGIYVEHSVYDKVEIDVYDVESFLPTYDMFLKNTEGMISVSDVEYNKNGVPYFEYRFEETKTVLGTWNGSLTSTEKTFVYNGIYVIYETEDSFHVVDLYSSDEENLKADDLVNKFVKWSELSYVLK